MDSDRLHICSDGVLSLHHFLIEANTVKSASLLADFFAEIPKPLEISVMDEELRCPPKLPKSVNKKRKNIPSAQEGFLSLQVSVSCLHVSDNLLGHMG